MSIKKPANVISSYPGPSPSKNISIEFVYLFWGVVSLIGDQLVTDWRILFLHRNQTPYSSWILRERSAEILRYIRESKIPTT